MLKIKNKFQFFGKMMIASAMVILMSSNVVFAAGGFTDLSEQHPNFKAIMALKERGIIGGYPDGTFKADQVVNRVEALKILLQAANVEIFEDAAMGLAGFEDIDSSAWYAPYLRTALSKQIVSGYPDATFRPAQTVNLVENLKMLLLAKQVDLNAIKVLENPFSDAFSAEWYAPYVQYAKEKKLIDADGLNQIYPAQGMTRGKLSEVAYRLIYMQENNLDWFSPKADVNDLVLEVLINDDGFKPNQMTVPKNVKVKWTNVGKNNQSVRSLGNNTLNSPVLENGNSYYFTFTEEGEFNYFSSLQPDMKGKIIVKPAHQVPTI